MILYIIILAMIIIKTPLTRFIIKAESEGSAPFIRQPSSNHQPVLGENILIKPKISTITAIVIIKRYVRFINFTTSPSLKLLAYSIFINNLYRIIYLLCSLYSLVGEIY